MPALLLLSHFPFLFLRDSSGTLTSLPSSSHFDHLFAPPSLDQETTPRHKPEVLLSCIAPTVQQGEGQTAHTVSHRAVFRPHTDLYRGYCYDMAEMENRGNGGKTLDKILQSVSRHFKPVWDLTEDYIFAA